MTGYDNRLHSRGGGTHLSFTIGGRRFLYAYIRKNACTTMKHVMFAAEGMDAAEIDPFPFQRFYARWSRRMVLRTGYDVRLFIYRDPVERVVSLFNNKFIQRLGAQDILPSYERVTGHSYEAATFESFVSEYVSQREDKTDAHCHSQTGHLWPIRYTHALPMRSLRETMPKLLGDEMGRFFARPTNTSPEARYDDPSSSITSAKLVERYKAAGAVPSRKALVTPALDSRIRQRFQADYAMISRIERRPLHR